MNTIQHPVRVAALAILVTALGPRLAFAQDTPAQAVPGQAVPGQAVPGQAVPGQAVLADAPPVSVAPAPVGPAQVVAPLLVPPAPAIPLAPVPPAVESGLAASLLAGFHNDLFFIGNRSGTFWIAPTGRIQIDFVGFTGGVTNDYVTGSAMTYHRADVRDTFLLRRARVEMIGGFLNRFTWMVGADYDLSSAPIATDVFINASLHPMVNLQVGQFDAPFTMENRTTDKYIDFVERSLAVRSLGIPSNKEMGLMVWGERPDRLFYYSAGVFNGDGQNRLNADNDFDILGRLFVHPLINTGGPLGNLQLGGSLRVGTRGASTNYAYNSMSTPGGYTFFNSALTPTVNVVPDSLQLNIAGELDLPIDRFDLRGEFVWVNNGTREMGSTLSGTNAIRSGNLTGFGMYAQVGYWIWGNVGVNGRPGYENPPALQLNVPDPSRPPQGIEILARVEDLSFTYNGGSGVSNGLPAQPYDGTYTVIGLDVGANYWATRHVRFSLDYMEYLFPSQPANAASPGANDNRAHGPNGGASAYGELLVRAAIAI